MVVNPGSAQQVADYSKKSQETTESVDGTDVVGGTAGKIALDTAAFTPALPEEEGAGAPPAGEAPPAEAAPPAEGETPAEAPADVAPPPEGGAPAADAAAHAM